MIEPKIGEGETAEGGEGGRRKGAQSGGGAGARGARTLEQRAGAGAEDDAVSELSANRSGIQVWLDLGASILKEALLMIGKDRNCKLLILTRAIQCSEEEPS
eukprot:99200-Hanusia_phi.AAC.4